MPAIEYGLTCGIDDRSNRIVHCVLKIESVCFIIFCRLFLSVHKMRRCVRFYTSNVSVFFSLVQLRLVNVFVVAFCFLKFTTSSNVVNCVCMWVCACLCVPSVQCWHWLTAFLHPNVIWSESGIRMVSSALCTIKRWVTKTHFLLNSIFGSDFLFCFKKRHNFFFHFEKCFV